MIRFSDIDVVTFEAVAKERGIPLTVLDIRDEHAARVYQKPLVLVRPDQHVAWRGNEVPAEEEIILAKICGF